MVSLCQRWELPRFPGALPGFESLKRAGVEHHDLDRNGAVIRGDPIRRRRAGEISAPRPADCICRDGGSGDGLSCKLEESLATGDGRASGGGMVLESSLSV